MESKRPNLTKNDINSVIEVIRTLYLEDSIPWVCGYSGGKDSTAIVQLVWSALECIPKEKRDKEVHVISTDTLVESPVVASWVDASLVRMQSAAKTLEMPIYVHRLTPTIEQTFWVNLIGRGYPYPRPNFRWCTDRLKINPANTFIENMISKAGEAILVLGMRKAESISRKSVMQAYEKRRIRDHLSPNGSMLNSYIFTPIENWSNDNVWQYLMQHPNPWGHSNKDLMSMYRGASADGECPLVLDTATPSCGNSRFGCWVCTLVSEDKSMAAMIQNDEEKSWMLPLLDFRNEIAGNNEIDRKRRDFRRMDGRLTYHRGRLVHGPYTKETREYFLRRLLEVEQIVLKNGPVGLREHVLITLEELRTIRGFWLHEKHEFDDNLPIIYKEITGKDFEDETNNINRFFRRDEMRLLEKTCNDIFPDEVLMIGLQSSLLDIESNYTMRATRHGINAMLENVIKKNCFRNEEDALRFFEQYHETDTSLDDQENGEVII